MQGTLLAGRYRLGKPIGSGGMGTVWQATDERLHRTVAVKTLNMPSGVSQDDAAKRFEREALAAARLSSPYIFTIHDYGKETVAARPILYLVMEQVPGRSLDQVVDDGRVELARIRQWTRDICQALEAAHRSGIVHRDLKPANVMISTDGRAVVLDFGIARFTDGIDLTTLTPTGGTLGTPAYMSPEQATGRTVDARSDLYSLGCVLYTMLTGRPPFIGTAGAATLLRHLEEQPKPPSAHRSGLPAAWDALVLELLAKEPGRRPADARTVAARLDALPDAGPPAPPAKQRADPHAATVTATAGAWPHRDSPDAHGAKAAPAARSARRPKSGTRPVESRRHRLAPGTVALVTALVDAAFAGGLLGLDKVSSPRWTVWIAIPLIALGLAAASRALLAASQANRHGFVALALMGIPLGTAVGLTVAAGLPWWAALFGIPAVPAVFYLGVFFAGGMEFDGFPAGATEVSTVAALVLGAAAVIVEGMSGFAWYHGLIDGVALFWVLAVVVPFLMALLRRRVPASDSGLPDSGTP